MMFTRADHIKLVIPRQAIETVFDECDRYDADETGGRVVGTYKKHGDVLTITVTGIIEPGPEAQRTRTYLMQDGAYQERVFREIEDRDPSVEHLGTWHTHHVNMLRHLSGGDIQTYRRTVEHEKHNIDFFYALLVTERKPGKTDLQRYVFKNYVFQRGDDAIYEIPASALSLTDEPLAWPLPISERNDSTTVSAKSNKRAAIEIGEEYRVDLAYDQQVIANFYPKIKSFKSQELGIYWRGSVALIDSSEIEVVAIQDDSGKKPVFTVTLRNAPDELARSVKALAKREFSSCLAALIATERTCNAELFEKHSEKRSKTKRGRLWMF